MSQHEVVLVGVDGSAAALHALDWAVGRAKRLGWRLHIVCAYSLPSFSAASLDGGYAALDDTAIHQGAQAVIDEALERVKDSGVEVTSSLETGDAAGVLVELSRTAGLAVVGTGGYGGITERLLGTVSSALPAHAHCPTVVVPLRTPEGTSLADDDPIPEIRKTRRIVVGVDGSPPAEAALTRALAEAQLWDAELTIVTGVPVGSGASILGWLPASIDREQVLADVAAGLDVLVDRVAAEHPGVKIKRHVLDGTGASLLTEFSTAVELIVVGSRGRGGFAGMLLGSTSQTVLNHAVCPVMVVTTRVQEEDLHPTAVAGGVM